MDSSEPTYVATTVFANKQQFDEYNDNINKKHASTLSQIARFAKAPVIVHYEGTLMLSAPKLQ